MLIQLFIIELNLLWSFHSLSISFPFFNDIFILFGNFSPSFIIYSLPNFSSNFLSTSNNSSSSLSFNAVLIFVKIFWIFDFNFSFFSSILTNNNFNSWIVLSKFFDKSSIYLIFSFNLFFFFYIFNITNITIFMLSISSSFYFWKACNTT